MNRILTASLSAVCIASSTYSAGAAIYYFDASVGGTPALGEIHPSINPLFGSGFETAQFVFSAAQYQPGDIINLGTVSLGPSSNGLDQYGDLGFGLDYFAQGAHLDLLTFNGMPVVEPNSGYGCNVLVDSLCPAEVAAASRAAVLSPIVEQLVFTIGTTDLDIQMAWAFADYSAPAELTETPLPAGLPLFATALGVMGLLGRRRKRRAERLSTQAHAG